MGSTFRAALVLVVLAIAGILTFAYSGLYNVAATGKDSGLLRWLLHTTMERSVDRRAADVVIPADVSLDDPQRIAVGLIHYDEMCVVCHGAPGVEAGEARQGLNPRPPELAEHAAEISPQALFWIIKHGVEMTGMPAWGPTHDDQRIWDMVAFLQQLPGMTAADYAGLKVRASDLAGEEHHHGEAPMSDGALPHGDHDHGH